MFYQFIFTFINYWGLTVIVNAKSILSVATESYSVWLAGSFIVIVIVIVLLGVFYNDIRGYEKIDRVNEWVLYYCEDCDQGETVYDGYLLLNGFSELSVDEAIEISYFTEDIELEIIALIESRE